MHLKLKGNLLLVLLFAGLELPATERMDMLLNDNWKFTFNHEVEKSAGRRVDIPHTWNSVDALNGQLDYYRSAAIYQKKLVIKHEWKNKRLFLKFDGVNTIANVFVNGKHVGEHRGGYTAFIFEISDAVNYGEENELMVRVSNALNLDVMPLLGDFNFYGGIFRDVHLLLTDQNCISPLDHASSGVYLSQKSVNEMAAEVRVRVLLDFLKVSGNDTKVVVEVKDGERLVTLKAIPIKKGTAGAFEVSADLNIEKPRLWNGRKDPFLYGVEVSLVSNDTVVDVKRQPLGLRYFHVDAEKGLFLNGGPLKLKGVCRHEDHEGSGNALSPWQHEEDIAILLEMGANAIRLSHYPQSPYFYELLDRHGILAWSEIPFVGPGGYNYTGFVNQASFRENGKQQLVEMIRQNYNHPSIIMWGLYNELNVKGDNPTPYVSELNELAHLEDPYRPTVSANNINDEALTGVTDLAAWNQYFGWYGGEPADIGGWADKLHAQRPTLRIALSEYGAGGSIHHHENGLNKPAASSYWHPEEWQAYYHEEHWKAINQRPFIWGSFIWNLFDFGAAHRREGDRDGKNDKGIVSYDRKIKKDAWWFYKASWREDVPVLFLTGKRYIQRTDRTTDVKVYTNGGGAELFVNGESRGRKLANDAIILWDNIQLAYGENNIQVVGKNGQVDSCTWYLRH